MGSQRPVAPSVSLSTRPAATASRGARYFALEQRVLLDAAAVATADAVIDSTHIDASRPDTSQELAALVEHLAALYQPDANAGRAVLFVDARVPDIEGLLAGLDATTVEIHLLDASRDGLAQIREVLANGEPASSVHIISHGSSASVTIGATALDAGSINSFGDSLREIGGLLTADADILLYGCNIAAGDQGAQFVDQFAALTGADVAASTDLTGSANAGGDWDLEYAMGEVRRDLSVSVDANAWEGVLLDGWDADSDSITGTWAVATTQTTDGAEWKFVSTPGATGNVYVYARNWNGTNFTGTTGNWVLFQTITVTAGQFGWDMAAAANKLAVSAPEAAGGGSVYVYTYNAAGGTANRWNTATAGYVAQVIARPNAGNHGYDNIGQGDRWGYSVDLASNGTTYQLVVGNPTTDYSNDDYYGTKDDRTDAGTAFYATSAGHTTNFGAMTELSWIDGNGSRYGDEVAVGYSQTTATYWTAVGSDGNNAVRIFSTAGTFHVDIGGWAGGTGDFGAGNINSISIGNRLMAIGTNGGDTKLWHLDGSVTGTADYTLTGSGTGSAVSVYDTASNAGRIATSNGTAVTVWTMTAGVSTPEGFTYAAKDLEIDQVRALDVILSNGVAAGARSYHFNWDPDTTDDVLGVTTENAAVVITGASITANDTDPSITGYGTLFGDVITVSGGSGVSAFGATVTVAGNSVTYDPTTSAYLQTLTAGQSTQETIVITIGDGQGGTATQLLTVTINGVNDVPYATALTPLSPYAYQQSGSTNAYDFSSYFSDVDSGEANGLVPSATVLPPGWTSVADGTLLRVTVPAGTAAGNYTITVRVTDPQLANSVTRNFVIAVDAANNAPFVQSAIPDQVALAGYDYGFTLPSETFGDPDPAPFDTITYSATLSGGGALPAWLTFDPVFRTFTGSPAAGDVGSITVRVTANDNAAAARGGPATVFDEFTLTIVNPTVKTLTAALDGPAAGANLGFSTAISEDGLWLAVGAPSYSGYGSLMVYEWNGAGWTLRTAATGLTPTLVAGSQFGWSVDLSADGSKIVVGARSENAGRGAVYCYTRAGTGAGTTFTLNGKLTANASTADDRFGSSVAINEAGTYILVGASHFDYTGLTDSGAAFMAAYPAANGALTANVLPKDPAEFDLFGSSVAFDQNILVVSAPRDDNAQGMVSRLAFDETGGNYTAPTFGSVGGTLNADAQFFYDGTRADVVYLNSANASGMVNLSAPIDLGASWTISSWYKGLRTVGAGEWRTLTRGTADHQIIVNDAGLLGVYDNAGGTGFVSSGYNMGALNNTLWHNIVAVGEGTSTKFYIDGVLVGTVGTEKPTDDIVVVGNYQGGGQRFSDYLDDFRVYDRALSQSEIRNIYSGTAAADAPYGDLGSIYVFSTDAGNAQVAKLYAPDGRTGDMVGWSLDLDIYDIGATTRQGGIIVASSIYNDDAATDGGAVYVWRSTSQASGTLNNGGTGNGTWILEAKLTSFDTTAGDYFGSDVAVDYDESTGGTRLLVGSQFEDTNGAYAGAVYAYKFNTYTDVRDTAGSWVPEKFASAAPQGGSQTNSEFFGSAVAIADTRAIIGARWRDTGGQLNDGAVYWANLLTQGNYATLLSAETSASESFFLSADEMDVVALDTSSTQGTISFAADGRMVYTPGAAFKTLGVGQTATDTFTYLTEQGGTTYTHTVTVTVHGVDDGVQAGNDLIQVSASSATLLNVLANDLDPDTAGLLAIRSLATGDTVGRLYNTGAALVYDPAGRFDALASGEMVQEVFSYTVTNSAGQETTAYVTLMVVGEDDPVVATNDAVTVKADAVVTVNVLANDSDKDGAGTFSITGVDDSGALGSAIINADGTISYLPGSAFRYLKAGETATDTIVYMVRDATGNESSAVLVVTVVGVNDAPVAFNDGITAGGGTTVAVDVLANDSDPDGTLRIARLITDGTSGNAVLNADGTISYTASAAGGLDKFSYEVVDSLGKSSIATVYVNHPDGVPGIGAVDDVAVTRGLAPVSVALTANDGGSAQVTSVDATGGVGSVELGDDGVLVYTPGEALAKLPAGTVYVDTVSYSVQYADGSVGAATLRVYVNGQYVAPTVEEEDEERFALAESTFLSGEVPVVLAAAAPSSADLAAPVADNVARMALAGMVEMAAAESAPQAEQSEEPVQPDLAAQQAEVGKPGLSAALSREVLAKRAGVDALLRHFVDHAA